MVPGIHSSLERHVLVAALPTEPNALPGNVILYAQDGNIRSLPHQAVLDRPELAGVYGTE
ncbi:MAG: hypothetical protein JXM73_23425 [Anaerolineae bacterium]|nr:hypothetical protein [Anaerolineae bacterium]